ncbi:hypothetical protein HAX54_024931, partial [Datura stramonium]|nr:hypothetical protein [Datura stramonium]
MKEQTKKLEGNTRKIVDHEWSSAERGLTLLQSRNGCSMSIVLKNPPPSWHEKKSRALDELDNVASDSRTAKHDPRFAFANREFYRRSKQPPYRLKSLVCESNVDHEYQTSHPRTEKQSVPTDKGKRKEKRPVEAEAESGFDLELEEALHKATKDEERKAELRGKRGEDALRFNAVPGMKERFFKGTHNRNFNKEMKFSLNRIEHDFSDILHQIKERYMEIFTLPPSCYCPIPVKVRGVEVDCSAKAINKAYFDDDDADATKYLAKLENPKYCRRLIKIQDEMNPKLKKRKREPLVAHASETEMGIDSQVEHTHAAEAQPLTSDTPIAPQSAQSMSTTQMVQVANMTARNNTKLTLLIEHISDMIKRAIDKALALVHVKIQYLEHRVSKLEGIGAREALAVLKADMSKVKIDVQQLHPDLNIFDAPLPEDECFEDERVESNEEDMEDDHVTKELDEE